MAGHYLTEILRVYAFIEEYALDHVDGVKFFTVDGVLVVAGKTLFPDSHRAI